MALCALTVGVLVASRNSPAVYRTALARLRLAETVISQRIDNANANRLNLIEDVLTKEAANRNLRTILYTPQGVVLFDSEATANAKLPQIEMTPTTGVQVTVPTFVDSKGATWVYDLGLLRNGNYLLVTTKKPKLQLGLLLTDNFIGPFIYVGLIGLVLSFVLALLMTNWIAGPLQRITRAADEVAKGSHVPIPPEGPAEVKTLAVAFNQMSQQVMQTQNSQKEFLANVSHELKTPLTSIQGFAQAILDGTVETPEALKSAATVIFNESSRMYRMVLDLLTLTRLEAGTADLQKARMDLRAMIQAAVQRFQPQAQQSQVNIIYNDSNPLPFVMADGDRLGQVLNNLLDNALKFTPAGGSVGVSAQATPTDVFIQVHDSGPGILPGEQKKIFERFYQVDHSRKGGNARGFGLGLPIARQIMRNHGGDLWVESVPPNGSTFIMRLPLSRPEDSTLHQQRIPR
jgi:signal transduction histidine kinase